MSVYKRGAVWRAEVRSDRSGEKSYRITRTFDTKTEALAFQKDQRRELAEARRLGRKMPEALTLSEALDQWWAVSAKTQAKSYRSTNLYRMQAWQKVYFAKLPMAELSVQHLEGWVNDERDRDISESTIRNCLYVLRALFKFAQKKWKWLIADPTVEVLGDVGNSNKRDRRLSPREFEQLGAVFSLLRKRQLDASNKVAIDPNAKIVIARSEIVQDNLPDRTIELPFHDSLLYISGAFQAALEAAMRRGRMFEMRWNWIEWETRMIAIPPEQQGPSNKKAPAKLPMSPALVQALQELNGLDADGSPRCRVGDLASEPVFGSLASDRAYRLLRMACDLLYIKDLHWHDLRHEACSRLAEQGWTIQQIQMISGHKTLQSLQRYMHIRPESIHLLWREQDQAQAA